MKVRSTVSAAILLAILAPTVMTSAQGDTEKYPILASCSRLDSEYDELGFNSKDFQEWRKIYHSTVNSVIEEYFLKPEIDCGAEMPRELLKTTEGYELYDLAKKLPPWKWESLDFLSRADTGLVLLEYLRIYECAMQEHTDVLEFDLIFEKAAEEAAKRAADEGKDSDDKRVVDGFVEALRETFLAATYPDLTKEALLRRSIIDRELDISRTTLHRALTLIGSFDRFRPLEAELECAQRLTLDIRNITALSAEASACLPRVWNAKGPLRNSPQ